MPELSNLYFDLQNYNNGTLTTDWVNIQNSVNILFSVKSNQNCDIYADFSKNADHIVESTTTKSLLANNSTELIVCCLSRYVRFRIENYAMPVNLLTQGFYFESSILQNTTSNTVNQVVDVSNASFNISNFPTNFDVDVTNFPSGFDANITNNNLNTSITNLPRSAFNTPLFSKLYPFPGMQYSFNYVSGTNQPIAMDQQQITHTPYLYTFGYTDNKKATYSSQSNLISLCGMEGVIGDFQSVTGDNVFPYRPGQTMVVRFTGMFSVATLTGQYDMKIGLGLKTDKTLKPIYSGTFVGWDETDQLYVSYFKDSVETKILQSAFNGDTLDGLGASGFLVNAQKINIYQIKYAYLGVANIQFEIYNPDNGTFITMHTVKVSNNIETTHLTNPCGSFMMQMEKKTNDNHFALFTWKISSGSFACFLTDKISTSIGYSASNTVSLVNTNETRILILDNSTNWVSNKTCPLPIILKDLHTTSYQTSGGGNIATGVVTYRIYRKPSYSIPPTYTSVNLYKTPIKTGSGETFTSFGTKFDEFSIINGSSTTHYFNEAIILAPGNDIVITATSSVANFTSVVSVDWLEFS